MNSLFQYLCKFCKEIVTIGYDDWFHNYKHCQDEEEFNEGLKGFPEVHI